MNDHSLSFAAPGAVSGRTTSGERRPPTDAPQRLPAGGERALVLGGGGSTGNAWLIGIVAGLFDAGCEVTAADLTVGTSSGATAAAQLAGATASKLYADLLAASQPPSRPPGPGRGHVPRRASEQLSRFHRLIADSSDVADLRRRAGAAALATDPDATAAWREQWRATVAARLPGRHWPERTVLIAAVDANTGEPVGFDRDSGVDLVDAVAASCAGGGFAYGIGTGRYIDGGYRHHAENADLATGYRRVLVLPPTSGRSPYPKAWGTHLAAEVTRLRAGGSAVLTIVPDSDSEHLFANPMDQSLRSPAAQAGYAQGEDQAGRIAEFWR